MDDTDADETGIRLLTGGPLSAHHLLLALAGKHRITLHADAADVDHTAFAAEALEIWQSAPTDDGLRWRWMLLPRGRVVEEAPGDPHRLRPHEPVALTVTRSTLPDRDAVGAFRKGLRAAGASCTLTRPTPRTAVRERETVAA